MRRVIVDGPSKQRNIFVALSFEKLNRETLSAGSTHRGVGRGEGGLGIEINTGWMEFGMDLIKRR